MHQTAIRQLPDFIIIGAMKAGTDSLYYYMDAHPEIDVCKIKEPDFFLDSNWSKGVDWYKNLFPRNGRIKGDASPNLSKYPAFAKAPERIYSVIPDVKLIYVLKNPVDRIISHLHHSITANALKEGDIATVFHSEFGKHIINCSKYYMQIKYYLKTFKREQLFLLLSEDLASDPDGSMRSIFKFVGVDESFSSPIFHQRYHQSKDKIQIRNRDNHIFKLLKKLNNHPMLPNKFITRSFSRLTSFIGEDTKEKFFQQTPKPVLSDDTVRFLQSKLSDDVAQLSDHMGRDLKEWQIY